MVDLRTAAWRAMGVMSNARDWIYLSPECQICDLDAQVKELNDAIALIGVALAAYPEQQTVPLRCRYPECVENEEERCTRWVIGDCTGPSGEAQP